MTAAVVITAAGSSSRMGGPVKKEYRVLRQAETGPITVLSASLHAFLEAAPFYPIIITGPAGGEAAAKAAIDGDGRIAPLLARIGGSVAYVPGGASRQDSVRRGLEAIAAAGSATADSATAPLPEAVLVHDGARPWVSAQVIRATLAGVADHGAAVPAIAAVDTQKETDASGRIVRHLDRSRVVAVQTPQGFRFSDLLDAHRRASGDGVAYTDDTEIWGRYVGDVYVCTGDRDNKKITFQEDLA